MNEKLIIVIYVGVAGIRSEDIEQYTHIIAKKISPSIVDSEIIIIPTQSYDTRIECINPKYITDEELIRQHTELMKKLQEELQYQAEFLKKQNKQ